MIDLFGTFNEILEKENAAKPEDNSILFEDQKDEPEVKKPDYTALFNEYAPKLLEDENFLAKLVEKMEFIKEQQAAKEVGENNDAE